MMNILWYTVFYNFLISDIVKVWQMDTEAASILLQFITVGAAEWAPVLSMGITYMDIQVTTVHKLTIT